jgi:branched-chain amino acid transport system ATP-binding protein
MSLLRAQQLHAGYGKIVAVRGIDLHVEEGEIVGLVGPNGAGKSSTLGALAGLVEVKAGEVTLDEKRVTGYPAEAMVRLGLSLVPEGRRIFARLTVAENLTVGTAARRDRSKVAADRERLLEIFPILAQRYTALAGTLSGGEQQQLAIARALMAGPRILLLDEPSLGLAPILVRRVMELVARLRDSEGLTILLVEQNVHLSLEICDRAYLMRVGQLLASGTPDELRRNGVVEAYLGKRGLGEDKVEKGIGV